MVLIHQVEKPQASLRGKTPCHGSNNSPGLHHLCDNLFFTAMRWLTGLGLTNHSCQSYHCSFTFSCQIWSQVRNQRHLARRARGRRYKFSPASWCRSFSLEYVQPLLFMERWEVSHYCRWTKAWATQPGTFRYTEILRVPESIDSVHNQWNLTKRESSTEFFKHRGLISCLMFPRETWSYRDSSPWYSSWWETCHPYKPSVRWWLIYKPSSTFQFSNISGTKQSCQSWQWYQSNCPTLWPPSVGGPTAVVLYEKGGAKHTEVH